MAEILKISPFDSYPDCSFMTRTMGNYREDRGINDIEAELQKDGFPFSFRAHLKDIADKFPQTEVLNMFEGGCGEAVALGEIKKYQGEIGRPINTIGATKALRNIPEASDNGVDTLLVGEIQRFLGKDHLMQRFTGQIHFILDYKGPLWYESEIVDGKLGENRSIMAMYGKLLASKGTMLCVVSSLIRGEDYINKTLGLFEENHLNIVRTYGGFALLEKQ